MCDCRRLAIFLSYILETFEMQASIIKEEQDNEINFHV